MIIKHIPEDFVVEELIDLDLKENGDYGYFKLIKKAYNTLKAIDLIAEKLRVNSKNIKFSGTKDRKAVTTQYCSLWKGRKDKFPISLNGISAEFIGYGSEPISLGTHNSNHFIITIRDLSEKEADLLEQFKIEKIVNYFGEQRFSNNNADVGRAIVKKDFKKAVELILENKGENENLVADNISSKPNDFVGALKRLPLKLLTLYVGAYQAELWNLVAEEFSVFEDDLEIPIIGFGTDFEDEEIKKAYETITREEKITFRDFIIPQIPELSSEGSIRKLFVNVEDFSVSEAMSDEFFPAKKKIIVQFTLPKGSYATVLVETLSNNCLTKENTS